MYNKNMYLHISSSHPAGKEEPHLHKFEQVVFKIYQLIFIYSG